MMKKMNNWLWKHYVVTAMIFVILAAFSTWQGFRRGELLCRWCDAGISIPVVTTIRIAVTVLGFYAIAGVCLGMALRSMLLKGNRSLEEDS